jgi:hypothetical protein
MCKSTLVLATFAGFLGGAIASRLFPSASRLLTVHAQGPGPEILQSRSFVLLDSSGRKRGEWTMDPSGRPILRLLDAQGRVVWDTTGTARPHLVHEP